MGGRRSVEPAYDLVVNHLPSDGNAEPPPVLPGDVCTFLRCHNQEVTTRSGTHTLANLVHRFWRYEYGTPSITITLLRLDNQNSDVQQSQNDRVRQKAKVPTIVATQIVESITIVYMPDKAPSSDSLNKIKSYGNLEDWTTFVVHRILLYCDDFNKSSQLSLKGSAGGCYFLPMSLPLEQLRSTSAVKNISDTSRSVH